ncbi:MAG: chromosome segregation protein SMC [Thermoleophilia bacterium]|nr:chromosome segregation protein SMC [Thermoleophilia bacterium]
MAFLRSISLKGFKTFARATELVFESGVTVIIGPNGSGKSNIADAVLWALGEQSPTSLRGRSMQDVIFSGSDGQRPAAMAEVTLTFDNHAGEFPIDYSEVEITRRVLRDGSSEYRINGSARRLLDVQELVAGVGLGREMHSVISQGKVDELINSTPATRRALVEEAAGLGRYKKRRDRSQAKLERVRENVRRVCDLEREVRNTLRPLKLQATAAERHAQLTEELAGARGRAALRARLDLQAELDTLEARRREIGRQRVETEEGLTRLREERAREEEQFAAALRERERLSGLYHQARADLERVQSRGAALRQRLARTEGDLARAARRRELAESEAEAAAQRLTELRRAPARGGRRLERVRAAGEATRAALETAKPDLGRLIEEEDELKDRVFELEAERSRRAQERELLRREVAERLRRKEEMDAQEVSAAARIRMLETELAARQQERRAADATSEAAASALAYHVEEAARLRAEAAEARALERQSEEGLAALASRRRVLEQVCARREGVPQAARALLESQPGAVLVVEALRVAPGYERAVAAALGALAAGVVVPGARDLRVVTESGGALEVVWPLVVKTAASQGEVRSRGGVDLWSVVEGPQDLVAALRSLLPPTAVLDDVGGWDGPAGVRAVTRRGQVLHGQVHAAVREEPGAEALLAARSELQALTARAEESAEALARARAAAASTQAAVAAAEQRARGAEQALREARRAAAGLADEVDLFRRRLEEGTAQLAEVRARAGRDRQLADDLTRDLEAVVERAAVVEGELETARAALRVVRDRVEGLRTQVERLEGKRAQASLLEARLREQARAGEEEMRRSEAASRAAHSGLEQAERQQALYGALAPHLSALHEVVEGLAGEFALRLAGMEGSMERAREAGAGFGEALKDHGRREADLQQRLSGLSEGFVEVEVRLAHLQDSAHEKERELGELRRRHLAPRSVTPDDVRAVPPGDLEATVRRLEKRLEGIGPVNPLAAQEYRETEERARFLAEQRKDLETSMAELQHVIDDLEEHIQSTFAQVFETTRANFSEMVEVLFPGGKGLLRLVEDEPDSDDLEEGAAAPRAAPGIALEIKPPKKAPAA